MAQHPIWRGHLRLALVSCPVALYAAHRETENLHFHFLNPKTGHRVNMVTVDAGTREEVKRRDLTKGFEYAKEKYVTMEEADFDRARIESSEILNVNKFVPAASLDPIYYETSYIMVPDGEVGEDVYAVLREAIAKTGRIALSRLVIARRERAVALVPMGRGLVVHTLYEARDLHDVAPLLANVPDAAPDPEMVKLATQLIDRQTGEYDPADVEDRYERRLREVIDAKIAGEESPDAEAAPDQGNVIDLMTALKRSLGKPPAPAKKPAKTPARKRA